MKRSREQIFGINPAFTTFIVNIQDLQYNPAHDPFKVGEDVFLGSDEDPTILTGELAERLNREEIGSYRARADMNPFGLLPELVHYGNYICRSGRTDPAAYLEDLGSLMENLRKGLDQEDLIVLPLIGCSWFQENEYPPVRRSMEFLALKIDPGFTGGFLLRGGEIIEFLPHLFWLVRCNAGLPSIYMSFPESGTVITLCRYGILHFEFHDAREKGAVLEIVGENGFVGVGRCSDPLDFDRFEGRGLKG